MKYLTPGPVQIPRQVIDAIAKQPQFHRTEEFREVFKRVIEKLSTVYKTTPVVIPGTGTLAVDVMVYNYINPGEKVVAITNGEFGDRLIESIESRGGVVHKIEWEYGDVPPPDIVEDTVRKVGDVKAIAVVHNETSTGTTNRFIEKYQDVADSYGAVLLVDSVSLYPVEVFKREIDVIATASQKAFISPPGAAILYIAKKPRAKASVPPSMSLEKFLQSLKKWETPYTPPINVIYGLDAALDYILGMSVDKYREMHKERAEYLYNSIRLKPVAREGLRSYTVTAFYSTRARDIIAELKKSGYVIAGGMGKLRDNTIRIGVMGDITMEDLGKVVEIVNRYVD
ncbi:MAG: alanine--glyoxylate aminotransferase family protein [Ignisphaera sp.]